MPGRYAFSTLAILSDFSICFGYFEKIKNEYAGSISLYQNAATKNIAFRTATILRTVKLN